jgi:hypothetical protein
MTTTLQRFRLFALGILLGVGAAVSAAESPARPKIHHLTDKTLVAWAAPANLQQQGGSVLTLIDPAERFDAVVLGEIARGKWMAGSDFFRRTHRDQSAWPEETADAATFVQVAAVYRGNEVSLFRDGRPYASYKIERPQPFGDDAIVLIGLRYVGGMGPIGHFAGRIEEARVYDVPLEAKDLAALRPGQASVPKPIGLWTFENGNASDEMKNFPASRLCGGARIEQGKLHLDGRDAYLIAEPPPPPATPLFYKPRTTGNMWDTWLYFREGKHYLYILSGPGGSWKGVALATSDDGAHWQERGMVLTKREGATWLGTGSTWASPQYAKDKKYYLNFSEWKGPRQTIFFAQSDDLLRWTRLPDAQEFKQDPRWYDQDGRWDCIYTIERPGGGLYGYWTANPKGFIGVGFGQSLDGKTWEALEPPKWDWPHGCELGAVEKVGETYYAMLGSGADGHHGMFTFLADRPQGPWRRAAKNFRLLTSQGHGNTYFARFYPTPQGLLVNHHAIDRNGAVYFGLLKRAAVDREGTMRLGWWEGNEKLKHGPLDVKPPAATAAGRKPAMLESVFDADAGLILEGTFASGSPVAPAKEGQGAGEVAGLYIEHGKNAGTALLIGPDGVVRIGPMQPDGSGFKAENQIDRQASFGPAPRFRLVLKGPLLEFYLNDVLIQCYSLPGRATGGIGLIGGSGPAAVADWKAWR